MYNVFDWRFDSSKYFDVVIRNSNFNIFKSLINNWNKVGAKWISCDQCYNVYKKKYLRTFSNTYFKYFLKVFVFEIQIPTFLKIFVQFKLNTFCIIYTKNYFIDIYFYN